MDLFFFPLFSDASDRIPQGICAELVKSTEFDVHLRHSSTPFAPKPTEVEGKLGPCAGLQICPMISIIKFGKALLDRL